MVVNACSPLCEIFQATHATSFGHHKLLRDWRRQLLLISNLATEINRVLRSPGIFCSWRRAHEMLIAATPQTSLVKLSSAESCCHEEPNTVTTAETWLCHQNGLLNGRLPSLADDHDDEMMTRLHTQRYKTVDCWVRL